MTTLTGLFSAIGTAGEYPMNVASGSGKVISGKEVIVASMLQLLGIRKGELPENPYLGSNLHLAEHEPIDEVLESLLRTYILDALRPTVNNPGEGRARVIDMSFDFDDTAIVKINITYEILASNEIDTFVYPFYRKLEW